MARFTNIFASAALAAALLPFAANAAVAQNTPPVISVSGASDMPSDLPYQLAHLNGEVTTLQQQVQIILQQTTAATQDRSVLFPDSMGG
jgi:hypothetical protein